MKIRHKVINLAGSDTSVAFIDVEGLQFEDFNPEDLYWIIQTYKSFLEGSKQSQLEYLLSPINNFLTTLTEQESYRLCCFFIGARELINVKLNETTYKHVVMDLGNMFYDTCMDIGLVDKLINYVTTAITTEALFIPDLRGIGLRPQDDPKYTFHHNDYVDLTAISLMCKLLGPIWGDLIYNTGGYIDNADKEVYCAEVISPVLGHPKLAKINDRFMQYIANITSKQVNRYAEDIEFIISHSGFTKKRFESSIYSILLVKRFVNVDLMRADCNIMKYVATSAEKQMVNQLRTMAAKINLRRRTNPNKTEGWESSVSTLEHESRVSRGTADIPIIVRVGIRQSIDRLIERFGIVPQYFGDTLNYYQRNFVSPSIFNRGLVSTLLSHDIGGAYGLQYLDVSTYAQLVVLTQLYIAQNFKNQLTHLLTCTTSPIIKEQRSPTDSRITMNAKASAEFRNVTTKVPYIVNSKSIDSQLEAIQSWIISYDHYYNTAPTVQALLDEDEPTDKGLLLDYDANVMNEIYAFITNALSRNEEFIPNEV